MSAAQLATAALQFLFVSSLLSFSFAKELHFELFARHGTISADLAAQGVMLFLSARIGIDFTRWNVTVYDAPDKYRDVGVGLDIMVDVPESMISRVNIEVKTYISTGALNEDFAREGIEDIKISFSSPLSYPSPSPYIVDVSSGRTSLSSSNTQVPQSSPAPSRLPVASGVPVAQPEELEETRNDPQLSSSAIQMFFSTPEPSGGLIDSAFVATIYSIGVEGDDVQRQDVLVKTKSDSTQQVPSLVNEDELNALDLMREHTSKTTPEPESAASSDLAERDVKLAPDETLSELLLLVMLSPVYGFPADLRDAMKWFLANETETSANKWYLWDVIERMDGSYLTSLRFAGPASNHNAILLNAKHFVSEEGLANSLLKVEDEGQFAVFVVDASEIGPEESGAPLSVRFEPIASPVAKPSLGTYQRLLPLLLNITSPVIGFGNNLEAGIAQFGAQETKTLIRDWALQSTKETENFGEFDVKYVLRVHKNRMRDISHTIIKVVRDRDMDRHLNELGFENVQVRLLPRLINFTVDYDNGKTQKRGELRTSAGTIAASVVGIIAVIAIGAAVFLICLPKGRASKRNSG